MQQPRRQYPSMTPSPLYLRYLLQEREQQRGRERKKGAAILLEQLAEREQHRIRADQLRRIEGEEMARRIEQLKLEEQKVGE